MKAKIWTVTTDTDCGTDTQVFPDRETAGRHLLEVLNTYPVVAEKFRTQAYLSAFDAAVYMLGWASENGHLKDDTIIVQSHTIDVPSPAVGSFVGVLDIPRSTVRLAVRMFIATFCMQGRICIPEHGIYTGTPATGAFDEHFFYLEDIADGAGEAEFDNLSQADRFELEALMKQVTDAGCWWVRFTE